MTAYVFIFMAGVMLQYSQAAVRIGGADAELNALCPATGYSAVSYPPSRCQPEKFILCAQGVADYVDSCASGLLFNNLGYCDYPENVPWPNKCPKNLAGTVPTSCSDPQAKSIAKSETCKKYYACDNGKPIEMPCPFLSFYVKSRQGCISTQYPYINDIPETELQECQKKDNYTPEDYAKKS